MNHDDWSDFDKIRTDQEVSYTKCFRKKNIHESIVIPNNVWI